MSFTFGSQSFHDMQHWVFILSLAAFRLPPQPLQVLCAPSRVLMLIAVFDRVQSSNCVALRLPRVAFVRKRVLALLVNTFARFVM